MNEVKCFRGNILPSPYDQVIENGLMKVQDEKIQEIKEQEDDIKDSRNNIIDFGDSYIIPGLIDVHCHTILPGTEVPADEYVANNPDELLTLTAAQNAKKALEAGITTIRDVGCKGGLAFILQKASKEGVFTAPRYVVGGRPLTTTGGHCHYFGGEVDTEEEMVKEVRTLAKEGADFIKVMANGGGTPRTKSWKPSFTESELRIITEEAHRADLPVFAHVNCPDAIGNCLRAGVDGLEHVSFTSNSNLESDYKPRLAELIFEKEVYLDFTLQVSKAGYESAETGAEKAERERMFNGMLEIVAKLNQGENKLIAGSDAGWMSNPFGRFLEPELLVKAGVSNENALAAATVNAAEALNLSESIGTLASGKKADFVVLADNPLHNISALREVREVVKAGQRVV